MTITPTDEQSNIIREPNNCVVIAKPGSGKTFTLSRKIAVILPELPDYRGIVAISYTNKASDELKRRCLSNGINRKGSFFGTIDKFFLSEIIIPFGNHVFGLFQQEFDVVKAEDVDEIEDVDPLQSLLDEGAYDNLVKAYIPLLRQLYSKGIVILETFGFLALYVYRSSRACRRYLKARYSHVIVDEYQDCGIWQHILFSSLVDLGLFGVAVGDLDQSIFAFANKDPRHLAQLAHDEDRFITYPLSINHRCHPSIINYSLRLLSSASRLLETDEIHVYEKRIDGSEIEIGKWLSISISCFVDQLQISEMSKVGILVRGKRTGNLVHRNLSIPHKPVITTPLDRETSLWGALFRKILILIFSQELTKYELVEEYLAIDLETVKVRAVMRSLHHLEELATTDLISLREAQHKFVEIAELILPRARNAGAISSLQTVLMSESLLGSYAPPDSSEVQLMTLHKAKGLEFDLVFHLDLYRWILPMYKGDYVQDLNLHYVGITRARKCCVLCTSSERHNRQGKRDAEDSEFLHRNGLGSLRLPAPF
ncbi:MAG: AAA family ATPase [Candidatus Lokiarchaeota archaeon]|nr:AAA family ATPase [Candidatus Lokiarchaeota archaeon]